MSAPKFPEVVRAALDARMRAVHVSLPARVESYDKDTQTISAQPLIMQGRKGEDGKRKAARLPVITNIPVMFQGSGSYWAAFPISPGDTVDLVFSETSLDRWLTTGGGEVDPGDDRRHDLNDAVAFPGLRAIAGAFDDAPDDAWVINTPTVIKLGSPNASKAPVTKDALDNLMKAIAQAINNLSTAGAPNVELTALQTALAGPLTAAGSWVLGGVATKVLVE